MITLPKAQNTYSKPIWNQVNNSDIDGSLYATYNCDLTYNEGKVRVGQRMLLATGQVDDSDMSNFPVAFISSFIQSDQIYGSYSTNYTIMGSYIWRGYDYFTQTALKDTHTSLPAVSSTFSDMLVFNSELYVTGTSSDAYYLTSAASAWATASGLGAGTAASLCVFQNRLYCGGQVTVKSMDTGHTVATSGAYTVIIPDPGLVITFIRPASNRIWIGTVNTGGGKAYVYEWDGTATQVTKGYRLESSGALACVIKDDIPYVMDANGKLIVWNGGTFTELDRLNRINNKTLSNGNAQLNTRFVHPNGMVLFQGKIYVLINGLNSGASSNEETIPSGIYEYTESHGLIHKYSLGLTKSGGTIVDYGQPFLLGVGALAAFNVSGGAATSTDNFFAGATYYTDATTTKGGIFYNNAADTLQKAGYFITSKLPAVDQNGIPSIQNMYNNIYTLYRKLLDSGDKITIKYRKEEIAPTFASVTWISTTVFTTTTDLSAYVGYEIEPTKGLGAGKTSHIVSAVFNAGTCTVNVDETYTSATGTSQVRIQNWKKISSITQNSATFDQAGIGELVNWIQFKVAMIFTGKDEIEKLLIINQNYNPPT